MFVKHKGERRYLRRASVNQLRINDRPGDELFTWQACGERHRDGAWPSEAWPESILRSEPVPILRTSP